jgi:hypothetical protein
VFVLDADRIAGHGRARGAPRCLAAVSAARLAYDSGVSVTIPGSMAKT